MNCILPGGKNCRTMYFRQKHDTLPGDCDFVRVMLSFHETSRMTSRCLQDVIKKTVYHHHLVYIYIDRSLDLEPVLYDCRAD